MWVGTASDMKWKPRLATCLTLLFMYKFFFFFFLFQILSNTVLTLDSPKKEVHDNTESYLFFLIILNNWVIYKCLYYWIIRLFNEMANACPLKLFIKMTIVIIKQGQTMSSTVLGIKEIVWISCLWNLRWSLVVSRSIRGCA